MSTVSNVSPLSESSHSRAFMATRSMTPRKSASVPTGICSTRGMACSRVTIISTQRWNSAPVRSSLLMKQMRGTW